MKRVSFIFATLVLTIVLLVVEIIIVRSASKYEPEVSIIYANEKIPDGTLIKREMFKERKVNISMVHHQSIRSIAEVEGRIAVMDIEEGEMILSSKLTDNVNIQRIELEDEDSRLFSVEFKADQVNGWWLEADQYVDVIFVPNRDTSVNEEDISPDLHGDACEDEKEMLGKYRIGVQRLRNLRIAALIDERGKVLKKCDGVSIPRYISFEVNDSQDEFLAYAKSNGRLELSVLP